MDFHVMPKAFFLFAPGAGAPSSHPWIQRWRDRLETLGRVAVFDYAYMRENRKRPDRLPQLVAAHRQALAQRPTTWDGPTILIGKSMGGRIGCHVPLEENVDALVSSDTRCRRRRSDKTSDEVLRALQQVFVV